MAQSYLIQMHQEGDVGVQVSGKLALSGGERKAFEALLGHICFMGVYMSLTPLMQLLEQSFRYLKEIPYEYMS